MKIAHITTSEHIDTLRRRGYHMALAQYLGRFPPYMNMFRELHKMGMFIIVDNGAAEGEPLAWPDVVTLANMVHADEVVMSDALKDGEMTLSMAKFIHAENLIPSYRRMAVPQGSTWEEWEECLHSLIMYCDFATIGVPKHLEELEGGRARALEYIVGSEDFLHYNIHLLGCYSDPIKEISTLKQYSRVRGLDTGAAQAFAQANVLLDPEKEYEHRSLSWIMPADPEVVMQNMYTLESVSNGL